MSRYARQELLPELSQAKIRAASVLIVGCGGLGAPAALYLAGAGVGRLGLVDADSVATCNLHRQICHCEATVGQLKVASAAAACRALNSEGVAVEQHAVAFTRANALALASAYDVLVDACDNAATRYLLSDAAVAAGKPLVSASALGWEGHVTVFGLSGGPCLRCISPTAPPPESVKACDQAGVFGPLTGMLGCWQAAEALKIICGTPGTLAGRMLFINVLTGVVRQLKLRQRQAGCAACGDLPSVDLRNFDYAAFCGAGCSTSSRVASVGNLPGALLVDVRDANAFKKGHIPNAISKRV